MIKLKLLLENKNIIVGIITDDDEIISHKDAIDHTEVMIKMRHVTYGKGLKNKWRYNKSNKTLYWWDMPKKVDSELVIDHLNNKYNQQVVNISVIETSDSQAEYMNRFNKAHGLSESIKTETVTIYQGRNVYNKGTRYFTTKKEWAQNYTQSGRENEITIAKINPKVIYQKQPLPEATDESMMEKAIEEAKKLGYKAIWLDEGVREPHSIFVMDMGVVKIIKPSTIKEDSNEIDSQSSNDTFKMYHGGKRWNVIPSEILPSKKNRYEGGVGIYLTNNLNTAIKYSKGSRVVQLVEIDKNFKDITTVDIPLDKLLIFLKGLYGLKHRKEIMSDIINFSKRTNKSNIPAEILNNLIVNYEAGAGNIGVEISKYFVELGIDACIQKNHGDEIWLIIFNPKIIKRVSVINQSKITSNDFDMLLVPINEGVILINKDDKSDIDKYISDMERLVVDYFNRNKYGVDSDSLISFMQNVSNNLPSNDFPFKVRYIFRGNNAEGYYDKDTKTIIIVVSAFTEWELGFNSEYEQIYRCWSVNFKKISRVFMHEFTHYIQDVYRQEKSGDYKLPSNWSNKSKYYKRGWEQQAHAIAYLEKLKQDLNTENPKTILLNLKKTGLLNQELLNNLKKSDYKSWKAIMKQVIMTTIADIENK